MHYDEKKVQSVSPSILTFYGRLALPNPPKSSGLIGLGSLKILEIRSCVFFRKTLCQWEIGMRSDEFRLIISVRS